MKSVLFWIFVGTLLAVAVGEVIDNTPCDVGRDANIQGTTNEISVNPCPGAAEGEPCELHPGTSATITIKFTPSIAPAGKIKSTIAWVKDGTDMTFRAMKPDACQYMTCPVAANVEKTFNATLSLSSTLPIGTYPLKVKLQELRGSKRVLVCQLFDIKLTDPSE